MRKRLHPKVAKKSTSREKITERRFREIERRAAMESFTLVITDSRGFKAEMRVPSNFYELRREECWDRYLAPTFELLKSYVQFQKQGTCTSPC